MHHMHKTIILLINIQLNIHLCTYNTMPKPAAANIQTYDQTQTYKRAHTNVNKKTHAITHRDTTEARTLKNASKHTYTDAYIRCQASIDRRTSATLQLVA